MQRGVAFRAGLGAAVVGVVLVFFFVVGLGRGSAAAPPEKGKRANRLARETSPYLLLHASNPVDWYPWGPEALARAKAEDKPIFLSVGYSSCYWCHVMERECFRDEAIARLLNERFVCIKVDREERPDVDQVYMTALQAFGNGGGWPMSMFLTPDGRPFFGGTYFPPEDRDGREGFPSVLRRVADAWRDHRRELEADANRLTEVVRRSLARSAARRRVPLSRSMLERGREQLAGQFDPKFGGFGYDPFEPMRSKFPEASNLIFLLDQHRRGADDRAGADTPAALAMVLLTLDHMARGGIRDQLGGGYHRYSTNRPWTVPHFEKMLYDNAQLASVHVLAFELTGDPRWRREAEATFAFVARTLTSPEGAFFSSLDAETEGEEGQYYVWTREEVRRVLDAEDDFQVFARVYGLDRDPNFEKDRHVLFEPLPVEDQARALGMTTEALEARLRPLRERLLAVRDRRPALARDDKVLAAWNGLMIAAYADGFRVLKDNRFRHAAERAADFVLANLRGQDGHLLRSYRAGKARLPAYLEDYAFLIHGLLRLHAATGDPKRLAQARELADRMVANFADSKEGGFFFTGEDQESLLARPKDPYDNALPSGNSVAIRDLVALAAATGDARDLDRAGRALETFSPTLAETPVAAPLMLVALREYLDVRPEKAGRGLADAAGAPEPGENRVVTGKASLNPSAVVKPGRELEATLILSIKEGWHLSANPTGSSVLKPTVVTLPADPPHALLKVEYPPGQGKVLASSGDEKVWVYEGQVSLTVRVRLDPATKRGVQSLNFQVRYQACNDRACLAPATLSVPFEVDVP